MSIQFRSRIRTVADYGAFGLSDLGVCCSPTEDAEPTCKTYQSCMEINGWWRGLPEEESCTSDEILEGWTCPDLSSEGCCCNCSLLNNDFEGFYTAYNNAESDTGVGANVPNGTKDMTYCECMDIGGNWTQETCGSGINYAQLCQEDAATDIRFPSACCVDGSCIDVCTPQDCVNLGDGNNILYENKVCSSGPVNIDQDDYSCDFPNVDQCFGFPGCGSGFNRSAGSGAAQRHSEIRTEKTPSGDNMVIVSTSPTDEMYRKALQSGDIKAACVEPVGVNYTCTQKTKATCRGAWMGLNQDSTPVACTDSSTLEVIENINKDYIPSSTANGWNLGQQVFGKGYDGRFFGIFNPASIKEGNGSQCYGKSVGVGLPDHYNADALNQQVGIAPGNRQESHKKYAIIVDNKDWKYNLKFGNTNGKFSSRWDTITNKKIHKNVDLVSSANEDRKGWFIPSQDVLSFIVNQLNNSTLKTNLKIDTYNQWHHFKLDRYYWTSTVSDDGVYAQKVNSILPGREDVKICNYNSKHFTRLVYLKEIK